MREVYYHGVLYTGYLQVGSKTLIGEWCWDLHKDGQLVHKSIKTSDLDIRTVVDIIMDTHYEDQRRKQA